MIYQVTPGILDHIHKNGCYYLDIIQHVSRLKAKTFWVTVHDINHTIYDAIVAKGWMEENCYINNPDKIFEYLGLPVAYKGHKPANYICTGSEIEINLWRYEPRGWAHFVNGNGRGITTYDPWGVSTTATKGYLHSKRIFEVIG